MQTTSIERKFLFALLAIVLFLVLMIFLPFLTTIILAAAFAVVLSPVYRWIKKYIAFGKSGIASFVTVLLFIILLCGPLFTIGTVVFKEAQNAYFSIIENGSTNVFINKIDTYVNGIMPNGFVFNTYEKVADFVSLISGNIMNFFTSTFRTIVLFILMLLAMFYLLKDGEHWKNGLVHLSPLSEENMRDIIERLKDTINGILKGSFIIAIVQGILIYLGFTIFGVPNGALWGLVGSIASFVPSAGTSVVTIPAIIYLFVTGATIQALGLLIWSIIVVGLVDNLLSPYLISKKTNIPSIFILFAILGGITFIGPAGILIGPLVLSLLYSLVDIYRKEIKN